MCVCVCVYIYRSIYIYIYICELCRRHVSPTKFRPSPFGLQGEKRRYPSDKPKHGSTQARKRMHNRNPKGSTPKRTKLSQLEAKGTGIPQGAGRRLRGSSCEDGRCE